MKLPLWLAMAIVAAAAVSCTAESQVPDTGGSPVQEALDAPAGIFIPGQANLYLDEETVQMLESLPTKGAAQTASAAMNKVLSDVGATSLERIFPDAGEFEARSREMGLHRWYRVKFNPSVSLDQASGLFRQVEGVLTFERNLNMKVTALELPFNDPSLSSQWQYYNPGGKNDWMAGADMDVFAVWKYFTTGNPAVKVAVVDSGVQLDHEDLAANIDAADSFNFITMSGTIQQARHGTHVAGTIAAVNNNGIGVSGMAGGDAAAGIPGVKVMSLQILSEEGGGSGAGDQAIKWAADHGAVLCNNSWGYSFEDEKGNYLADDAKEMHEFYLQPNEGDYKSSLKSAIDYFNLYAGKDAAGKQTGPMAGGVVFFSAGNDNRPWGAPASYPGVIAVGSIGPHGYRTYYSNFGDWVDISATGGDANYGSILSTFSHNEYGSYQGTSMSCPHITGVAALLVSYFGGQGFTREQLLERLMGGVNPVVSLSGQPIGKLSDAYAAFTLGEDMTPSVPADFKGEAKSNSITVSWSVTGSSHGVPAAGYYLFSGSSKEAVENATVEKPGAGVSATPYITTTNAIGTSLSQVFPALKFETPYYFKLQGYDVQGHFASASPVLTVTTLANQPPVITSTQGSEKISLKNFETKEIGITVTDPDGHGLTVEHVPGSAAEKWTGATDGWRLVLSGAGLSPGEYTSLVRATDTYGAVSECKILYQILPNQPPVSAQAIDNVILAGTGSSESMALSPYFSDPDGEALKYSVSNSATQVVHANLNDGTLYITALGFGMAVITVTASDARGDSVSQDFRVLVREAGIAYQAYPNPVETTLYLATGEDPEQVDVSLTAAGGAVVYHESLTCSAFTPASIDMSAYAPGRYALALSFGGKTYHQTLVKK